MKISAAAVLVAVPALVFPAPREESYTLATSTGNLYGTLVLPASSPPFAAALIISGSGPTDRDGNTPLVPGSNDHLKLLAHGLGARGVASLRYDKRGIAQSAAAGRNEADLRFETYIDDAVAWGKKLRSDPRISAVAILGHSEGSLIGMMAAQRLPAVAFVSLAGPGRPAPAIIREQLGGLLPESLRIESERIVARLQAGQSAPAVPQELYALFRPSVQPYLISWFRYDPSEQIGKLKTPVLIIQGDTDRQVTLDDARRLGTANPRARLHVVAGMNHLLKSVPNDPAQQLASFSDPSRPVEPKVLDEIIELLGSVRVNAGAIR